MSDPQIDLPARESAALALYQSGDADAAANAFRELLVLYPEHATALEFLGFYTLHHERFAESAGYYSRLVVARPTDAASFFNLAMAEFAQGHLDLALAALDHSIAIDPFRIDSLLYRGLVLERMLRPSDSVKAYLKATRFAETQIDSAQIPNDTKRFLNHALGMVRDQVDKEISTALAPLANQYGEAAIARMRKAGEMFSGKLPAQFAHPKWRPGLFYVPDLPPQPFYEREDFDWITRVEAATDVIREELLGILTERQGFAPYVNHPDGSHGAIVFKSLNRSEDWSAFHFFRDGERVEANCARCPRTAALLDSLDLNRVPGYGPEVMFSVLKPHSHIPAHYGTVNGRLVVHLPLIVPPNCGALSVAGEERAWTEGKLMFFDDTFEHEAWNNSDQVRVVLIFDTWNPNLTMVEREAFCAVLGAAQQFERDALAS